jgi:hypothetical protein
MVDNNIIYVWQMVRGPDGAVRLPLDPIRTKKGVFKAGIESGNFSASGIIYSNNSSQIVYVNQIIATDLSGDSKQFALSCYNLSGEVKMTQRLGLMNNWSSGQHTSGTSVLYDNLNYTFQSGSELVYSGQKIMVASGSTWNGEIGLTITIDPNIPE